MYNIYQLAGKSIMFLLGEMIPKMKARQIKGATAAEGPVQTNKKGKEKKKK